MIPVLACSLCLPPPLSLLLLFIPTLATLDCSFYYYYFLLFVLGATSQVSFIATSFCWFFVGHHGFLPAVASTGLSSVLQSSWESYHCRFDQDLKKKISQGYTEDYYKE